MYFGFKDLKWGKAICVVSDCNSDTLDLSNTLSEMVKSVCKSFGNQYEMIFFEDTLIH